MKNHHLLDNKLTFKSIGIFGSLIWAISSYNLTEELKVKFKPLKVCSTIA